MSELSLFNVTEDGLYERGGLSTPAYRRKGQHWNGWEIPYFTKEQLDKYIDLSELYGAYVHVDNPHANAQNEDNQYLIWRSELEGHKEKCKDYDLDVYGCHCNLTTIYTETINGVKYYLFNGWCFYDADD
jgi:hypothetical protein